MAYRSYEELGLWRRGVDLAVAIYHALNGCQDFGLRNQLCRAAVSIPSNIAEGVERESKKESVHFLHIAKGSCAEHAQAGPRARRRHGLPFEPYIMGGHPPDEVFQRNNML
jgi:four helix bundle protein